MHIVVNDMNFLLISFFFNFRYREGKAKWLKRYLSCKKELYTMRNVLYMDHIATACSIYRGEQDDDGDEEESDEENEEQSGNEEESNNTSESDV